MLRVLLDPERAAGIDDEIAVRFPDGSAGLHVRNGVAVPTDGAAADPAIELTHETWAELLAGRSTLGAAVDTADAVVHGARDRLARVLACFDVPSLRLA